MYEVSTKNELNLRFSYQQNMNSQGVCSICIAPRLSLGYKYGVEECFCSEGMKVRCSKRLTLIDLNLGHFQEVTSFPKQCNWEEEEVVEKDLGTICKDAIFTEDVENEICTERYQGCY